MNAFRFHPYGRFTERVRKALQTAEYDARRDNSREVDTEHILLGLISESSGCAVWVLKNLGVDPVKVALKIHKQRGWQTGPCPAGQLPLSTVAQVVLGYAVEEARELHHDHVGTEHLLVSLLREEKSFAARVLSEFGVSAEAVRNEILRALSQSDAHVRDQQQLLPDASPLTKAESEFHLGMYRLAVDYYKPRIENRTGVDMGHIAVWDYMRLHHHMIDEVCRNDGRWLAGALWRWVHRKRLRRYVEAHQKYHMDHASKCIACYYRRAIYVSFATNTPHEETVAATVVHELSHALWHTLEDVAMQTRRIGRQQFKPDEAEKYRLLGEGFAVYGEQVHFLDLYPVDIRDAVKRRQKSPRNNQERGFRTVERLVVQHGPEIFLQIPKRWRELDVAQSQLAGVA